MAIQTQEGLITGTVGAPALVVTVWDDAGAALSVADARDEVLASAPNFMFGFPKTDNPGFKQLNNSAYQFEVQYRPQALSTPPAPAREIGTLARRASFQAQSKLVKTCLEPIGVYDSEGDNTSAYPNLKWMVNVQPNGYFGTSQLLGMTVDPLPETRSLEFYIPNAQVSDEYVDALELLCGKFNDATAFNKPQGSLQLVRANLDERSPDDWTLSLGFGYKAAREDVDLGSGITIPELRASWDYWTREESERIVLGGTAGIVIDTKIRLAVVQRMWDEADFSTLSLPDVSWPE